MTAEICVLNRHGISIAADSAVTLRNGGSTKVFDSAEKIFTLSKKHPVGAMIYGRSDYLGNPFEIMIKEYRDKNIDKSFDTVEMWGTDFVEFINEFMTNNYSQDEILKLEDNEVHKKMNEVIHELIGEFSRNKSSIKADAGVENLGEAFGYFLRKKNEDLIGLFNQQGHTFGEKHQSYITVAMNILMSNLLEDYYDADQAELIVNITETVMLGSNYNIPGVSGIVIMGYGEKEIYPSLVGYKIKGQFDNKVNSVVERVTKISALSPTAAIDPFAQTDVVNTFIRGISNHFLDSFHEIVEREGEQLISEVQNKLGSEEAKSIRDILAANRSSIHQRVNIFLKNKQDEYTSPLINMVALLPKDELSSLAEALVSITSLKRRVSSDDNTVGGPIDVAMITRSEGFIWIKRKHYFTPELNHSFFSNYFNEKGE